MYNTKGVLVTHSRLHSFCSMIMQLFSSEHFEGYINKNKTSEIYGPCQILPYKENLSGRLMGSTHRKTRGGCHAPSLVVWPADLFLISDAHCKQLMSLGERNQLHSLSTMDLYSPFPQWSPKSPVCRHNSCSLNHSLTALEEWKLESSRLHLNFT